MDETTRDSDPMTRTRFHIPFDGQANTVELGREPTNLAVTEQVRERKRRERQGP